MTDHETESFITSTIKRCDQLLAGERQAEQAQARDEWDAESRAEYEQWSAGLGNEQAQILDEEYNDYWAHHCARHGEALQLDGSCVLCEGEAAEERRQDL